MSIFGPVKKTQGVLKPPGAYFYGGFDSTFWHFGANAKIKWAATVHWVLHSQVVLKTVCVKKDDPRTYRYEPLKNIYGVSPPIGAFSSECPVVTSAGARCKIEECGAYEIF